MRALRVTRFASRVRLRARVCIHLVDRPPIEPTERPTVFVDDHVSKSFRRMNRRSSPFARRAFSGVQIDISSSVMRVKTALYARDENA
ncbi:hypothetical protein [Burkholderia multivorans]|uniref:hypothetical protein n=1 Tax=Burkholderia multivorans TaxID=87883 RepID=UPI0020A07B90|nr:hypothetical protein [Burkholderia multivorans]